MKNLINNYIYLLFIIFIHMIRDLLIFIFYLLFIYFRATFNYSFNQLIQKERNRGKNLFAAR